MFIELANFSEEQSSFKNFHCFPFGGFEKTCHWLNALQNGDFTMKNDKIVLRQNLLSSNFRLHRPKEINFQKLLLHFL